MNYKPDEGTLMAYLYGELDAKEAAQVEAYFNQYPEERIRVSQLATVGKLFRLMEDQEVIAPPVFMGDGHVSRFWKSGTFKTILSIAASFLFLLVAARLIGPDITYSGGELRISFNKSQVKESVVQESSPLTSEEVQQMINESLVRNNEIISSEWENNNLALRASLEKNFASNSAKIDELMKVTSQASQDQIRSFVAGLQQENLQLMKDYLKLSTDDQKTYVEALLVDFSKYLQEQRKQDLQLFQTRMSSIEKNTDQFKQETEQILASIISNPESIKKVNNY